MYILAIKTMWLIFFVTFTSTFSRRTMNIISIRHNFTLIPYSRKIIPSIPECPHSRTFEKNWLCSCVPVTRSLILLVCCCLQLDREVCNLGNQDLGSDLIGSVVVGAAGCGARKELIIRTREDAMRWAEMDPHGGPFPCPSSCQAPCLPCPPRPCPTDPCR